MSFLEALLHYPLFQSALFAGLLAALASGIIGSFVVVKRIVFISGSISHSVLGGMGFFLWLNRTQNMHWLSPLHGALFASIGSALLIGWIHLRYKQREDAVIAALWSTGMAIGVIFISITPGSSSDLTNFLIGNILWVNPNDLYMLIALNVVIITTISLFYKKLLLICFDEEQALLQGIAVERLYLLLLVLIAISIVLLVQFVGIILVIALLTLPPTIANLFTHKFFSMIIYASLLGCFFCFSGMGMSYYLNWPPGATIAFLTGTTYIISLLCVGKRSSAV